MTDITKEALSPPRSFLSQDAIQVFYRLLAALLICAVLVAAQRLLPQPRQHPQRAAAGEPDSSSSPRA